MDDGYIKLHRSITKWEWYQDQNTKAVFIHLLIHANWEDSKFKSYDVPKGSLICGRKKLAADLGLSEQEIRTSLEHLKSTNEITIKTTNKFSIVSIVNWEKYQGFVDESTNKTTIHATNNQPTINHIKEYKEIKNKRNIYINMPPTVDEVRDYCLERKNKIDPESFINFYESKGWMIGKNKMKDWKAAVRTWERNRKQENKSGVDLYRDTMHGNYDFAALERETNERSKNERS